VLVLAAFALVAAAAFAAVGGATTAATAPTSTAAPKISGNTQQGQTLTTTSGTWSGTTPMTFSYGWEQCDSSGNACTVIAGATDQTYTLSGSDVNHTVESKVTAKNSAGSGTATSSHTAVISGATAPTNNGLPQISGSASVGHVLTASNGSWNGTSPISYAYAWRHCTAAGTSCSNISGATSNTYTVQGSDQGRTIRVVVTASNAAGQSQATSNQTAVVTQGAPTNTVAPSISGSLQDGGTLTVSNGTWTGSSITYAYQWERCDGNGNNCAAIGGATHQTYLAATVDVGHKLRALVTATNSLGSNHVYSNTVGPIVSGTPTGVTKLPDGELSISASSVTDADRMTVAGITYAPSGASHAHAPVQATFKVVEEHGYVVSGALVYVIGLPYNWMAKAPEAATGVNGRVTITITPTVNAPRHGQLVMFVRARTPKGNLLAGSSTRRLIQLALRR
jgi:hypothetical protein